MLWTDKLINTCHILYRKYWNKFPPVHWWRTCKEVWKHSKNFCIAKRSHTSAEQLLWKSPWSCRKNLYCIWRT